MTDDVDYYAISEILRERFPDWSIKGFRQIDDCIIGVLVSEKTRGKLPPNHCIGIRTEEFLPWPDDPVIKMEVFMGLRPAAYQRTFQEVLDDLAYQIYNYTIRKND